MQPLGFNHSKRIKNKEDMGLELDNKRRKKTKKMTTDLPKLHIYVPGNWLMTL